MRGRLPVAPTLRKRRARMPLFNQVTLAENVFVASFDAPLIRLRHLLPPQKARGEKALDWKESQKCVRNAGSLVQGGQPTRRPIRDYPSGPVPCLSWKAAASKGTNSWIHPLTPIGSIWTGSDISPPSCSCCTDRANSLADSSVSHRGWLSGRLDP